MIRTPDYNQVAIFSNIFNLNYSLCPPPPVYCELKGGDVGNCPHGWAALDGAQQAAIIAMIAFVGACLLIALIAWIIDRKIKQKERRKIVQQQQERLNEIRMARLDSEHAQLPAYTREPAAEEGPPPGYN
jgi:hypothetical protein